MEHIGQGGNWDIYRFENTLKTKHFVFRIPKFNSESKIENYLYNYSLIKKLKLPTLNTAIKYSKNRENGIKTEDLNYLNDWIYVSHNSLYSDSLKQIHQLSNSILKNENQKKNRKSPEIEEYRYRNRLSEILNFNLFLEDCIQDLIRTTENDILIEYDSYFFGSSRNEKKSDIDYKIVDLDNIFDKTEKKSDELFELNLSEFTRAITGFVNYFIDKNEQDKYLNLIEKNYAQHRI
ncbi:hypothetical protein FPF71_15815 [Algibacter amylolyticus]|uniref:Uncharacterized protein n=1 Tax=Algibacter amylolyticus TaxID=1608400 RepID=A0A5M7B447_9FLAO|nr:hypothetical protein [Algibacter amylolyticus]KAA5821971.1 hypothetical protein F2B50_15815 [Algibacter amylolyticus]MBB5269227.1 hypothetical protein [Algibacter amylolyticus]TSJ73255.1 hypothetical protein FPF71_15815 [Algibacter amylolyticus]